MIIYKDILTGDEMFSDIYKITESANGMLLFVEGKIRVIRSDDIDGSLIGANASAEVQDECFDTTTVSGVDIIFNHKLQEALFNRDSYESYMKNYIKAIRSKLEESNKERVEDFQIGAQTEVKKIQANFENYKFFTGESMDPSGMTGLLDYREDGQTPYMTFFKDGLQIEKY